MCFPCLPLPQSSQESQQAVSACWQQAQCHQTAFFSFTLFLPFPCKSLTLFHRFTRRSFPKQAAIKSNCICPQQMKRNDECASSAKAEKVIAMQRDGKRATHPQSISKVNQVMGRIRENTEFVCNFQSHCFSHLNTVLYGSRTKN